MPKKLLSIKPSTDGVHKYVAKFEVNGKSKTTQFGAKGYSDFTKNKDPDRKASYLARHRPTENWSDPTTAGALSRYVLWNKPTIKASIADYKSKFKL